jgi:hypothetical protein
MSRPATARDTDPAAPTPDDKSDTNESAAHAQCHVHEDATEESAGETSDSADAVKTVIVDATHATRDGRGIVNSMLITITSPGTPFSHSDRGDIGKAKKRAEIIKAVQRKRLGVDEQALDQALIALAQKFNSMEGEGGSGTPAVEMERFSDTPYFRESGALYVFTRKGPKKLTGFDAAITSEVLQDDGSGAPRRYYELSATVPGMPPHVFEVPEDEFNSMVWVSRHLGANALVYAGRWVRDHARTAIQDLSPKPIWTRHVYTHLGVRVVDGERMFLHAGGALSARGIVSAINVRLPEALARYDLPAPPTGADLAASVRVSLGFLRVAPPRVTVPLLASAYRAPLGRAPFSVYAYGKTEAFKTGLVVLIQQHFGAGMDEYGLPGSWSSTGNSVEALAFYTKDVVFTVDDFTLTGSLQDAARKHGEADRVLRAQANQRGRQRMASDQSLRPAMHPRGLIVATGEELPRGQSLRNRMCTLECKASEIAVDQITECQQLAGRGEYAKTMSGYIVWMLAHYEALQDARADVLPSLRDWAASHGIGRRTATVVAELAWGWCALMCFARDAGLAQGEVAAFTSFGLQVLIDAGRRQRHLQAESDPVSRFIALINSALASGRAHVACVRGECPPKPEAWGWREIPSGEDRSWMPQKERIGWIDGTDLYLEPEAGLAVVQQVARDGGDPLLIDSRTLHRRLHERGLLVNVDVNREVLTVRRVLEARRRDVLHLHADALGLEESTPRTAVADNAPPSTSLSSDGDGDTGLDDDRDVVSDLARSLDYPIMELGSEQWVLPGRWSWEKFIAAAGATALRDARQCLERLALHSTGSTGRR